MHVIYFMLCGVWGEWRQREQERLLRFSVPAVSFQIVGMLFYFFDSNNVSYGTTTFLV